MDELLIIVGSIEQDWPAIMSNGIFCGLIGRQLVQ